jgi:hypothetical protein
VQTQPIFLTSLAVLLYNEDKFKPLAGCSATLRVFIKKIPKKIPPKIFLKKFQKKIPNFFSKNQKIYMPKLLRINGGSAYKRRRRV